MNTCVLLCTLFLVVLSVSSSLIGDKEEQIKMEVKNYLEKEYDFSWRKMFDALDTDGDGKIVSGELKVLFEKSGGHGWFVQGIIAGKMIERLDKNGDDAISFEEIPTHE